MSTMIEALAEAITTELATKADLAELKVDMIKWIVGVGLAELAMLDRNLHEYIMRSFFGTIF